MSENNANLEQLGKVLIYQNENGDTKIDVYFEDDTVWMSQKSIAELYQVDIRTVNEHILNVFADGELFENPTIRNFRIVQKEGQRDVEREIKHYNLQMILAVGYRVRNNVGMHFRNWTSSILTEYMRKGFVMNDERLKNPKAFGEDFFDELLERIRDIRASEKRVYEKVKAIFATSADYDGRSVQADKFFKSVQNKLEFASTGCTAPEIIANRADASKDNMGLKTFKGVKVRKGDVTIAKNYMEKDEIDMLNRIVTMYLDYAEFQAKNHAPMYMNDWENKLNDFLKFNGREVLQDFGKISREIADKLAIEQYEKYDTNRRMLETDIDKISETVKKLK